MHIFNLLLYNLLQANIKNVAIFHCWHTKTMQQLAEMLSNELLYTQYINLAEGSALDRFQYRYFGSQLPRLGVFLDMSCERAEQLMNETSRERLYTHRYHWLLYDQSANLTNLQQLFEHANLSINADITYVMPRDNDSVDSTNFVLYDVYNKGSHIGGKLNITVDQEIQCNVSACATARYLSELHKRTRLQQRSDLSSVTFRISTIITTRPLNEPQQDLLDFLNSEQDAHIDWLPRLGFHLLKVMQDILGFNMSHTWSYTWSENDYIGGVINAIVNESAEVATTPFVLSPGRLRYVVGLTEISSFRSICIFRTPHNAGIKTSVFLEPFTAGVWFVFAGLLLVGAVLLWLTFRMEHQRMRRYLCFMPSLLTTCLISFGAACIQGSNLQPRSTGGRIVLFVLLLTSFLMYNYYTSIVVSTLLGSPLGSNIKTVQQLADSSLDVGFEPIPFTRAYLNASPRADIQNLKKAKIAPKKDPESVWLPAKDGILRVRDKPGFVYVSETSFIYYYIEKYYMPHEICELNEISFRPENAVYSLMHQNSTYRELYKQHEIRLLETGIEWKHRTFWSRKKLHCYTSNYVITVGMEYAAPLFILLLSAYIVVLIVLGIEIGVKSYMQRKRNALIVQ